jgi:hypothetical protein
MAFDFMTLLSKFPETKIGYFVSHRSPKPRLGLLISQHNIGDASLGTFESFVRKMIGAAEMAEPGGNYFSERHHRIKLAGI